MAAANTSELVIKGIDELSPAFAKAGKALQLFGQVFDTTQRKLESSAERTTRVMNNLIKAGTAVAAAGFAIKEGILPAIEAAAGLEKAMLKVQLQSGRTQGQMEDLQEGFEKLSKSMYFGVKEIAEASSLMTERFRVNSAEFIKFMSSVDIAARATNSSAKDTAQALKIFTGTTGVSVKQAQDIIVVAAKKSNTSMEEMGQVARRINDEMLISNQKGQESFKDNMAAAMALKEVLGVSLSEASEEVLKFQAILTNPKMKLLHHVPGLREAHGYVEQIAAVTKEFHRREQMYEQSRPGEGHRRAEEWLAKEGVSKKIIVMINEEIATTEQLRKSRQELAHIEGASDKDALVNLDLLENQWKRLTVAFDIFSDKMVKAFRPFVVILKGAAALLEEINELSSNASKHMDPAKDDGWFTRARIWLHNELNAFGIEAAEKGAGGRRGFAARAGVPRAHARGGIFNQPTLGIIGEAGPEAVIPLSSMSETESASRGQQIARPLAAMNEKLIRVTSLGEKTVTPLESIDSKMTKLLDAFKLGGGGGVTPGGGGGGGGTGPAGMAGGGRHGGGGGTGGGMSGGGGGTGPAGMAGGSGGGTAYDLIKAVGGTDEEARMMAAIAQQESSGNPKAHNTRGADDSYGLWQINMKGALEAKRLKQFGLKSKADLYDPVTNARVALAIKRAAGGYGDWGAYKSGAYKKYLGNRTSISGGVPNPAAVTPSAGGLFTPAGGTMGDPLLARRGGGSRKHAGVDIGGVRGSPVVASIDGTVEKVSRQTGYGYTVDVRGSDGRIYRYAHLQELPNLKRGDKVKGGQQIARMGASGTSHEFGAGNVGVHLHTEIRSAESYAAHPYAKPGEAGGRIGTDIFDPTQAYGLPHKGQAVAIGGGVPPVAPAPPTGHADGAGFQAALHDLRAAPTKLHLDLSEVHAANVALDKLHHKLKTIPHGKVKVSHQGGSGHGDSHTVTESMNRRVGSSSVAGMA